MRATPLIRDLLNRQLALEWTTATLVRDDPAKTLTKVYRIPELSGEGYYMAFGRQTPDATVARFRQGLEAIHRNGDFERLQKKWL